MDEALVWKGGHQGVPNHLRVFWHPPVGGSTVSGQVAAPLGFQLVSSLLCQSQQETLSAASPNLRMAFLPFLPLSPTFVIRFHADWAGNPRQPTFTAISHVIHPLFWQVVGILFSSSLPLPHSPPPTVLLVHKTLSVTVVDSTASGKWSFLPGSTWPADYRRFCLAWPWTTGLWPSFTKWWCSAVVLFDWTCLSALLLQDVCEHCQQPVLCRSLKM